MKKIILINFCIGCLVLFAFTLISKTTVETKPLEGFVPDENTAIKVAETVWIPVFGNDIYRHQPFKAELINGKYWKVYGTIDPDESGCPFALIQKSDCSVIKIMEVGEKYPR
jgi:hypothetical protein